MGDLRATQALRDIAIESASDLRATQALRDLAIETTSTLRATLALRDIVFVPVAAIPTDTPLVFAQIFPATGGVYNTAETPLADAADYYDGYKPATLLRVSPITRQLSRDGYQSMRFSVEVADVDRSFRGLASTATLNGAYVKVFIVDDAVRRAEGEPFQIAAGHVVDYEAIEPFRFVFHVSDLLGRVMGVAG